MYSGLKRVIRYDLRVLDFSNPNDPTLTGLKQSLAR